MNQERSRAINQCLAFASSQVAEANIPGGGSAPPAFVVNGEIIHNIGAMSPSEGHMPRFAQMYFHGEPNDILSTRQGYARLQGTPHSEHVIQSLETMIRRYSPFYQLMATALGRWNSLPEER